MAFIARHVEFAIVDKEKRAYETADTLLELFERLPVNIIVYLGDARLLG
nr:MAG TPA: hypothetical protein [Caudoviricetes sp.]